MLERDTQAAVWLFGFDLNGGTLFSVRISCLDVGFWLLLSVDVQAKTTRFIFCDFGRGKCDLVFFTR